MASKSSPWGGYTRATVEQYEKHRLIGSSWGPPGSRKTSFWLEGPAPVAVFSLDQGLEGVVSRILREQGIEKEIYVKEYDWSPRKDVDMQQEAVDTCEQFLEDYEAALKNARTVLLDKESDFWLMFRYGDFGPDANGEMRDYDKLNARYRHMVNMGKGADCNIGFIGGEQDVWGEVTRRGGARGMGPTGERRRSGFKELEGLTHMVLRHSGVSPDTWAIEVGKVRGPGAREIAGQTYPFKLLGDQELTFQNFAMMVFPESDESEWV